MAWASEITATTNMNDHLVVDVRFYETDGPRAFTIPYRINENADPETHIPRQAQIMIDRLDAIDGLAIAPEMNPGPITPETITRTNFQIWQGKVNKTAVALRHMDALGVDPATVQAMVNRRSNLWQEFLDNQAEYWPQLTE